MTNIFLAGTLLTFGGNAVSAAPETFSPGAIWPDQRGEHIQAHGGGITKVGDTYFWYGEDRAQNNPRGRRCVSCYASTNLAQWTFRHQVVQLADPEHLGRGWILERPKVFFNATTKQFVMYAHIDNGAYKYASVAVFTCATADGDFQYQESFRPLGHESRDIGQFVDDDGAAYLIFEDRPFGFRIAKLSADYLNVQNEICLIPQHLEGGAVVHYQGLYYVVGSELTGWHANPNKFATAKTLAGPWSEFKDLAPPEKNTYGAQSSMLVKVTGTRTTSVIFLGDLWKPDTQWDSRYLWLPLTISHGQLALPEPRDWTLDITTGEAKIGP